MTFFLNSSVGIDFTIKLSIKLMISSFNHLPSSSLDRTASFKLKPSAVISLWVVKIILWSLFTSSFSIIVSWISSLCYFGCWCFLGELAWRWTLPTRSITFSSSVCDNDLDISMLCKGSSILYFFRVDTVAGLSLNEVPLFSDKINLSPYCSPRGISTNCSLCSNFSLSIRIN